MTNVEGRRSDRRDIYIQEKKSLRNNIAFVLVGNIPLTVAGS